MQSIKRSLCAGIASVAMIVALAAPATAEESVAREGGWGVLAGLGTLVYSPTKVVYSGLGIVFGGIAYALSAGDRDVWTSVTTPAIRGDYVLQPAHLRGEQPLQFFGRDPSYDAVDVAAERSVSEERF